MELPCTRRRLLQGASGAAMAGVLGISTAGARGSDALDRYIIGLTPENAALATRRATMVSHVFDFGGIGQAVSGRFNDTALAKLADHPQVRYVEKNGQMHAHNQVTPWGIKQIEADVAIEKGHTGNGVSIAIIDSGIDAQHETLTDNLGTGWAHDDFKCDAECADASGPPWSRGNAIEECLEKWDDDNDHGSHVAGTAAAADNDKGVLGVAPEVTLHAVKVLGCDGGGTFESVAAGIEWSTREGHHVQNLSLGSDSDSAVVDDALAYASQNNVVIVASAGNAGPCEDCVGYPARHEAVIAVSATDEEDNLAEFSSTGPEVELAAPGVDILSSIPRDEYDRFSGTSMSAPHVAGAAASLLVDGTTDRDDIRAQLKDGAEDVELDSEEQGEGRLNVPLAIESNVGEIKEEEDATVTVVTDEASNVEADAATLNGEVTELEGPDEADVAFEYGKTGEGLSNTVDAGSVSSPGTFETVVDRLDSETEYEYRAVAKADTAEDTGDVLTFTTDVSEDGGDDTTAPVIETFDLSDTSNPRWARVEVDWTVSDDDGNLSNVKSLVIDWNSDVSTDVSGSFASGTHKHRERNAHGEVTVALTASDTDGNESTVEKTITLE